MTRLLIVAVAMSLSAASAAEAQVIVQAGQEEGVGIPRWRDRECFVITVAHVVTHAQNDLMLRPARGHSVRAEVVREIPVLQGSSDPDGIAILRSDDPSVCSGEGTWVPPQPVDRGKSEDQIETRRPDGASGTEYARLTVVHDNDSFVVFRGYTELDTKQVQEGWSGSPVYQKDHIIGVLMAVNSNTKTVTAISYRHLWGALDSFFQQSTGRGSTDRLRWIGLLVTGALAGATEYREHSLNRLSSTLKSFPETGDPNQYNAILSEAQHQERERNELLGATAGAGGFTLLRFTIWRSDAGGPTKSGSIAVFEAGSSWVGVRVCF